METRYRDPESGLEIHFPEGWAVEPNQEEGGVDASPPGEVGILHLMGFSYPEDDFPDPAEELYAFLEEEGVELEEDEVEDLALPGEGEMALCEFISDDEEEGPTYFMVGVATAPGALAFATYTCAAGEEEAEREQVRTVLSTLRLGKTTG